MVLTSLGVGRVGRCQDSLKIASDTSVSWRFFVLHSRFHHYPNEGHGFVKKENQVTTSNKTLEFLDKYLKADGYVPNKKQ